MTQIVLNDEQLLAVRQASDPIEVSDESGILVGYVTRHIMATPQVIAEARRRLNSDGPWHTTEQFLARLATVSAASKFSLTGEGRLW